MPLSRMLQVVFALFFISILVPPIWSQKVAQQQATRQPLELAKPTRDAQAISVLNQAIAAAGGMESLSGVRDYQATGTVTRHEEAGEVQGLITITGSGVAQLRLDENLSTGIRSESSDSGRAAVKTEDGRIQKSRGSAPFLAGSFALPGRELIAPLKDTNLSVSYKGLVQVDGRSAHQIHVQRVLSSILDRSGRLVAQLSKDFFVDASTFQVLVIQDTISPSIPRKTRYADYRPTNGMLVPFSIVEEVDGKTTRTIRLDSIGFNSGIQKSVFDLSAH